jgi:hypothetical protein
MIELEACVATQSWVNREYSRGLTTHPCETTVDQHSGGVVDYLHHLRSAHQEVRDPVVQGAILTQGQ